MHNDRELIERRIERAYFERLLPAIHGDSVSLDLLAWTAPGEPVRFDEAMAHEFKPFNIGDRWARPWGTTWFKLSGEIPNEWQGQEIEAVIDIGFHGIDPGFQAEAMLWNTDGSPRCGVHPDRRFVSLDGMTAGDSIELILEAAANPGIGGPVTPMGSRTTAGQNPLYAFRRADIGIFFREVEALCHEVNVLQGTMKSLRLDDGRRSRILRTMERALDVLDLDDVVGTAAKVRAVLSQALSVPARDSSHQIVAVGHAHIDSAWLWPVRETVRKCARTFSSAVELMNRDADYKFVCSQAQQYAWMEQQYPELFQKIAEKVATGQFIPVGGMWVEADMNLPNGESLVRQLVHGQRYFESRFGIRCREVWIPDVFGYPGSLPQIFAAGGCDRFVTQKLSWNKQNKLPHHTFKWTGIDGTSVLTHFPPVDTYNALVTPEQATYAAKNFRDDGWSNWSLMPYGHGDGGGGPTKEMVARAKLISDLDGVPSVHLGTVDGFFQAVETDIAADPAALPEWRGELYFEMHRGTFTSQSNAKIGNRQAENLLREAELWWAYLDGGPKAQLDELWKTVLLLQFHDIIPGSGIAWVYEDVDRDYARVNESLKGIIADALRALAPPSLTFVNPATHDRDEVVEVVIDGEVAGASQRLASGKTAIRAIVPGLSLAEAGSNAVDGTVEIVGSTMRNDFVSISWNEAGALTSCFDLLRRRECIPHGTAGAVIELSPDFPNEYDAWDLESWARRNAVVIDNCVSIEVVDNGPLVGRVRVTREFGSSRLSQTYVIRAGSARVDMEFSIDWHEREHLLAVAFPLDVKTENATCEIQFGHVNRPTHANTSWDAAKFEVCAHRWVDVSEPEFGIAVLNNGRYGHAVQSTSATGSEIRVSLQKGARFPDPMADDGHHEVTLSLLAHGSGLREVVNQAEALNLPIRAVENGSAARCPQPIVRVDNSGVLVSAVKRSDSNDDLILRVWEAVGDRAILASVPDGRHRTNLLEDTVGEAETGPAVLRPFEIVTWCI